MYELTAPGRELAGALRLLTDWGARHAEGAAGAARGMRHGARGALVLPGLRPDGRGAGRRGDALRLTRPGFGQGRAYNAPEAAHMA